MPQFSGMARAVPADHDPGLVSAHRLRARRARWRSRSRRPKSISCSPRRSTAASCSSTNWPSCSSGSVFAALIFSISFLIYLNSWLSAFVGIFLTLVFMQLLALPMALVGQIVAEHAYTRTRKLILLGLAARCVPLGLAQMLWQTPAQSLPELAWSFRNTWTGDGHPGALRSIQPRDPGRRLFPDLVVLGCRRPRPSTWACWSSSSSSTPTISKGRPRSVRSSTNECGGRERGRGRRAGIEGEPDLRVPRLPWLGGAGPLAWRQIARWPCARRD